MPPRPAERPAPPELEPGEAVVAILPRGRSFRLADTPAGAQALVASATRDAAPSVTEARRIIARRLNR